MKLTGEVYYIEENIENMKLKDENVSYFNFLFFIMNPLLSQKISKNHKVINQQRWTTNKDEQKIEVCVDVENGKDLTYHFYANPLKIDILKKAISTLWED